MTVNTPEFNTTCLTLVKDLKGQIERLIYEGNNAKTQVMHTDNYYVAWNAEVKKAWELTDSTYVAMNFLKINNRNS